MTTIQTIDINGQFHDALIDPELVSGQIDMGLIDGLVAGKPRRVRKEGSVGDFKRRATVHVPIDFNGVSILMRLNVTNREKCGHKITLGRAFIDACNAATRLPVLI